MDSEAKSTFQYSDQRQAILKKPNGKFDIITQFGKKLEVSLEGILVYLFANEQNDINKIQDIIIENYKGLVISKEYIQYILEIFEKNSLIKLNSGGKDLHPIYSFNPFKVVKKLDMECLKDTIVSIGKLEFAITDACPFSCSYCSRKISSPNEYISFEQKMKLVYDCFEMGAYTLNITGGEPLFGKYAQEAIELVRYAKQLGYKRVLISTSGYGIIDNLDKLVEGGLDELQISYNKCTLFEEDRVRNKFVEENIINISKSITHGIRLGVCCVLTKENIDKIKEIIDFCIEYKLYSVYFYPVMPVGGAIDIWEHIKIDAEVLISTINKIQKYKEIYKDKIFISAPQSFLQKREELVQICEGGTYMLYVSSKGEVSSCACSTTAVENIKSANIEDIWVNSTYFDKYRTIKEYEQPCSECKVLSYCLNSCITRSEQAYKLGLKYGNEDCSLSRLNGIASDKEENL